MARNIDPRRSILFLTPYLGQATVDFTQFGNYAPPVVHVALPPVPAPAPIHNIPVEYITQLRNNEIVLHPPSVDNTFAETFVYLMLRAQDVKQVFKHRTPATRYAVTAMYDELLAQLFVACMAPSINNVIRDTVLDAIVNREHSLSPLTADMANAVVRDMLQRSIQTSLKHNVVRERARYGARFDELLQGSSVEVMDFVRIVNRFVSSTLFTAENDVCFREETAVRQERADAQLKNIFAVVEPLLWVRESSKTELLRWWTFFFLLTDNIMAPIWPFLPLSITTYRLIANVLRRCMCGVKNAVLVSSDARLLMVSHVKEFISYAEKLGSAADVDTKVAAVVASRPAVTTKRLTKLSFRASADLTVALVGPRWNALLRSCIVKTIHIGFPAHADSLKNFYNVLRIVRDSLTSEQTRVFAVADAAALSVRFSTDVFAQPSITNQEFKDRALVATLPLVVNGEDSGCLSLYADVSGLRHSYVMPGNACETQTEERWNNVCNFARNRVALIATGNA